MLEIHVNFPNAEEASAISREAVEKRLAACANVFGQVHSFYWWDEAVRSEDEVAVVLKTSARSVNALIEFIARKHSDAVPGIVVYRPTQAHAPYLEWIERETRHEAG